MFLRLIAILNDGFFIVMMYLPWWKVPFKKIIQLKQIQAHQTRRWLVVVPGWIGSPSNKWLISHGGVIYDHYLPTETNP